MDIKEFLSPCDTLIDVRASDKTRLLRELARRAAATLDLAPERIAAEILKRAIRRDPPVGALDSRSGTNRWRRCLRPAKRLTFNLV
jgi:hypothetical protein